MAEDDVKRVTGTDPFYPTISDMSTLSGSFAGSPSEISDAAVPIHDDKDQYFRAQAHDGGIKSSLPEIASATQVDDAVHGAVAGGKMGRTASMQRVASLEHLQKKICGARQNSTGSFDNDKQSQV